GFGGEPDAGAEREPGARQELLQKSVADRRAGRADRQGDGQRSGRLPDLQQVSRRARFEARHALRTSAGRRGPLSSKARNRAEGWPSHGAMPSERVFRVLDSDYPAALRELPHPPDPVWVRGELPQGPAIAIVGTRSASPPALEFAKRLARRL